MLTGSLPVRLRCCVGLIMRDCVHVARPLPPLTHALSAGKLSQLQFRGSFSQLTGCKCPAGDCSTLLSSCPNYADSSTALTACVQKWLLANVCPVPVKAPTDTENPAYIGNIQDNNSFLQVCTRNPRTAAASRRFEPTFCSFSCHASPRAHNPHANALCISSSAAWAPPLHLPPT